MNRIHEKFNLNSLWCWFQFKSLFCFGVDTNTNNLHSQCCMKHQRKTHNKLKTVAIVFNPTTTSLSIISEKFRLSWCSFLNNVHLNGMRKFFIRQSFSSINLLTSRYGHSNDSALLAHRVDSIFLVPFFGHRHVWGKWHRECCLRENRFYDVSFYWALCWGGFFVIFLAVNRILMSRVLRVISSFSTAIESFEFFSKNFINFEIDLICNTFSSFFLALRHRAGNVHFQQSSTTQPKLIVSLFHNGINKEPSASALRPLPQRSSLPAHQPTTGMITSELVQTFKDIFYDKNCEISECYIDNFVK